MLLVVFVLFIHSFIHFMKLCEQLLYVIVLQMVLLAMQRIKMSIASVSQCGFTETVFFYIIAQEMKF